MKVLKREKTIRVALAGNPNSGKSTIFNALTGGHAHVGNWPGVTVEKKEGRFRYKDNTFSVIDLPGTYSLTAYSIDERIARDFIVREKPDVVVCIVDATNIERNLYLVVSLLELGAKLILDLNMSDILEQRKIRINTEEIEKLLGIPVVMTSGIKGIGLDELKETIVKVAKSKQKPKTVYYGEHIEKAIKKIEREIEKIDSPYPRRFLSVKLLEGDMGIIEELKKLGYEKVVNLSIRESSELENKIGIDVETEIIEKRYSFIKEIIDRTVERGRIKEEKLTLSDKIDRFVTNKYLGIPLFALMMYITFQLTFTIGGFFADYIDLFFNFISTLTTKWLISISAPQWLVSLIGDGIISGVGSVVIFLPNIMILFLFFHFLKI